MFMYPSGFLEQGFLGVGGDESMRQSVKVDVAACRSETRYLGRCDLAPGRVSASNGAAAHAFRLSRDFIDALKT